MISLDSKSLETIKSFTKLISRETSQVFLNEDEVYIATYVPFGAIFRIKLVQNNIDKSNNLNINQHIANNKSIVLKLDKFMDMASLCTSVVKDSKKHRVESNDCLKIELSKNLLTLIAKNKKQSLKVSNFRLSDRSNIDQHFSTVSLRHKLNIKDIVATIVNHEYLYVKSDAFSLTKGIIFSNGIVYSTDMNSMLVSKTDAKNISMLFEHQIARLMLYSLTNDPNSTLSTTDEKVIISSGQIEISLPINQFVLSSEDIELMNNLIKGIEREENTQYELQVKEFIHIINPRIIKLYSPDCITVTLGVDNGISFKKLDMDYSSVQASEKEAGFQFAIKTVNLLKILPIIENLEDIKIYKFSKINKLVLESGNYKLYTQLLDIDEKT